jgi:hypothetical protein
MHLLPEYVDTLRTRMMRIMSDEYSRLSANTWWNRLAGTSPGTTQIERRYWLLSTGGFTTVDPDGGTVHYRELETFQMEFEQEAHTDGLSVGLYLLGDTQQRGLDMVAEWSKQKAAYAAYWPQKKLADAILANGDAYDGLPYFNNAHPINPNYPSLGTYSNDVVCNIATDTATAIHNFYGLRATIAGWKMPDLKTPRYVKIGALFVPPALEEYALQLSGAQFTGGSTTSPGSTDVSLVTRRLGLADPVVCDELGADITGNSTDDETFYAAVQPLAGDELDAMGYSEADPFTTTMIANDTEMVEGNRIKFVARGRNTIFYGHPYKLIRCSLS